MNRPKYDQYNNGSSAYKYDEPIYNTQNTTPFNVNQTNYVNTRKQPYNNVNVNKAHQSPYLSNAQRGSINKQHHPVGMNVPNRPNYNNPNLQQRNNFQNQQYVDRSNRINNYNNQTQTEYNTENAYYNNNYNQIPLKKSNRKKSFTKVILIMATVLIVGFILLNKLLFTASYYKIEGLQQYTDSDVLTLAGLEINQSLNSIKPNIVKERIESTGRLILENFEFRYPSGVYMYVRERVPAATLSSNGYIYTLDKDGVVLSLAYAGSVNPNYIEIKGCIIRELGGNIKAEFKEDWQRKAFVSILNELYKLNATNKFNTINLVERNNIYLTTRDGNVIRIGNIDKIGAKIRSAISVYSYLVDNQKDAGRIDVTIPENPIYSVETIKSGL